MTVEWIIAFLVGTVAVARLTRLVVFDQYPPAAWLRSKWDSWTNTSMWNPLLHCGYCTAPWIAAPWLAWGWFTDLQAAWWLASLWLAGSYLAAIVVVHDGDD